MVTNVSCTDVLEQGVSHQKTRGREGHMTGGLMSPGGRLDDSDRSVPTTTHAAGDASTSRPRHMRDSLLAFGEYSVIHH